MKKYWSKASKFLRKHYPILLCFFIPLILFSKYLISGKTLFWGTPVLQYIPWQVELFKSVLKGVFPWWNSLNGLGAPLIANYQSAFFYPATWILFLFYLGGKLSGLAAGNTLIMCFHIILTGVGMILFVKKLGLSTKAQAIAAVSFSLSGYIIARVNFFPIIWTITWLPWILFALEKLLSTIRYTDGLCKEILKCGVFLTICFSLLIFAGHAQTAWYSIIFAFSWWILRSFDLKNKHKWFFFFCVTACSFILAVLLCCIQLIPTAEYLVNSQRSTALDFEFAANFSFWPVKLITLFSPNFYGSPANGSVWGKGAYWEDAVYVGFMTLLLALATIRINFVINKVNRIKKIVIFLWIVILVSFGLAIGRHTPVFKFLFEYIPTFNLFQAPVRMLIWAEISFSLLAAIGFEEMKPLKSWKLYVIRLASVGAVGIGLSILIVSSIVNNIKPVLINSGIILSVMCAISCILLLLKTKLKNHPAIWAGLIIIFLVFDLLSTWIPYLPGVKLSFWNNYQVKESAYTDSRVYWDPSYEDIVKYSTFFSFSDFSKTSNWEELTNLPIANQNIFDGISLINNYDPLVPNRFSFMMEILQSSDIAARNNLLTLMNTSLIYLSTSGSDFSVKQYENDEGNFYWFFSCFEQAINQVDSISKLRRNLVSQSAWSEILVIENFSIKNDIKECNPNPDFTIADEKILPDYRSFVMDISESGYLMLSEAYYPGWIATIDDEEAPIYYGNGIFKSIFIPAGMHQIIFQYRPVSFLYGGIASLFGTVTIIFICTISFVDRFKENFNEKPKSKN